MTARGGRTYPPKWGDRHARRPGFLHSLRHRFAGREVLSRVRGDERQPRRREHPAERRKRRHGDPRAAGRSNGAAARSERRTYSRPGATRLRPAAAAGHDAQRAALTTAGSDRGPRWSALARVDRRRRGATWRRRVEDSNDEREHAHCLDDLAEHVDCSFKQRQGDGSRHPKRGGGTRGRVRGGLLGAEHCAAR
jgi:hypothetical protein